TVIDTNVFIQGVVTMTPELGNIPEFIAYIQDSSGAVTITVEGNNTFSLNSEVTVDVQGLSLLMYQGLLQLGDVNMELHTEVITLTAELPEISEVTLADLLNGEHIAELVDIRNVQFAEGGTFRGTKTLTDCSLEIDVYTRNDATFSGDALPGGNGLFRGIVSVFTDPQLIVRDPSELDMTGERCGGGVETDYLNETFESLSQYDDVLDLPGWTNPFEAGNETWFANIYNNNTYAQATAYNSGMPQMISWLITPAVDLSSSSTPVMTFDTKAGYDNGATLEVLVSSDYDGSGSPWDFTWTDLNPTLDDGPAGGYSNSFVSSGNLDLSAWKSNIYIAFKYTGADPAGTTNDKTTTWQIDNVLITEGSGK
ncbi:MAG: DUF5689 domain-containing protein, partial [Bacteroidales bacterium]